MLKSLELKGVGPAETFGPVEFAPRLNFITGDNGLGKSFLLDIAWWSLTRTWARGTQALPQLGSKLPMITYVYTKSTQGDFVDASAFLRSVQQWSATKGRPPIPGVVIYAGVDGSFSAWDPARNYWKDKGDTSNQEGVRAFNFTPEEVWRGLEGSNGIRHCNGLIQDWVLWQKSQDPAFDDLAKVLDALSPSGQEKLLPGKPVRIGLDVTDYPSLRMPYGQDVALVHASAGMRRIAALAYLLVWTWREHQLASKQIGKRPAKEIIFLIDEIECHLHPQWQRRIVPALLQVMHALTGKNIPVQVILATHSPLILASVEPTFDEAKDAVFTIALHDNKAVIEQEVWAKQGDVVNWLVSDAFGLKQARSVEAEQAIEAAEAFMRDDQHALPVGLKTKQKIHEALVRALPGGDHFWPRWIVWSESRNARMADEGKA
jgi:predicted ATPase